MALVASIPAASGGDVRRAYMSKLFNEVVAGGGPSDIRFAANIQVEKFAAGEAVPVFLAGAGDSIVGDWHYVSLLLGRDRAFVVEFQQATQVGEYPFPSDRIPPVGPGAWPRIEVRIAGNPPRLSVTLDAGTGPILVVDRGLASPEWSTPRPPELHLGIGETYPAAAAWQVRYDDIVVDLK
ncbi:hypothetical protein LVJ94_07975 [Pendulispora rubella]|uniref:Uncharacterized protein n=1 Tax=Pendulispora rubella TaxID=2741070 RepID=A0ABZ2L8S8_9BACT